MAKSWYVVHLDTYVIALAAGLNTITFMPMHEQLFQTSGTRKTENGCVTGTSQKIQEYGGAVAASQTLVG